MVENTSNEELISSSKVVPETSESNGTKKAILHNVDARRISSSVHALSMKQKKLSRLLDEKEDLKRTLDRGYFILFLSEGSKTQKKLTSVDRISIKEKIKNLDIEIFETQNDARDLREDASHLLRKNIRVRTDQLNKMKFERKFAQIFKCMKKIISNATGKDGSRIPSPVDSLQNFFSELPKSHQRDLERNDRLKGKVTNEVKEYISLK